MKEYKLNQYRFREIKDKVLVTADHNDFLFLTKKEFSMLKQDNINKPLFKKLEKAGIVLTSSNINEVTEKYKRKYSFLFQGASLHIVVPTLRCNHKCVYCHSKAKGLDEKGFDMDKATAKKTVDFIFQSPSNNLMIEFQGGEPLVNFEIVKFITEYAKEVNKTKKKDLSISIVSNLTLLDEEKIEFLNKNEIEVCTSLDGPEKVHNKNRKYLSGRGTYDEVVKKIKLYNEKSYKSKLNALMVITRASLPYHKEIIDEYIKQGLERVQLKFLTPLGFAKEDWKKISYSAEEFLEFWKKAMEYLVKKNKEVLVYDSLAKYMLNKIIGDKTEFFVDLESPCGAAIGQLAYDYNGDIYTCDEGRQFDLFKLGNVKKDNYKEVICSDKVCGIIASSVNDTQFCNICAYKPYCGICPVCNYATQGNLIAKLPEDTRCKILKGMFDYLFEKMQDPEYNKVFNKWAKYIYKGE